MKASGLLSPPLLAFLLVYVGSLGVLFVSAFWTVDSFTGKLVHSWNVDNFRVVFSYVWLPFMVLPVYAALERIPDSYLEASGDLGAGGWRTFRRIILPLALPGVVAGSIFTFSLTLGDYVTPLLVGGAGSSFIGNVVYENIGLNANVPFAAAFATVPVMIMAVYLLAARRLGAFEAL